MGKQEHVEFKSHACPGSDQEEQEQEEEEQEQQQQQEGGQGRTDSDIAIQWLPNIGLG